jgi:hypothetical protein
VNRRALAVLAIVAATALVYREAASGYFFEDDFQWLAGTMRYHPRQIFDLSGRDHFYRPVIEMYFWTLTPLFGGSPRLFHIASVVLHAVNGVLLYLLARALTRNERFAFTAALCFVVLPGYVEAVAWISALAEPVGAFFGCTMLYAFVRFRRGGHPAWRILAVLAFLMALVTHESSVVFLPLLLLADWAFLETERPLRTVLADGIRPSIPYAFMVLAYLAIDFQVNSDIYLVQDGHYRIGLHAFENILGYIVWLYVGTRDAVSYVLVSVAVLALLIFGTRRVRFAVAWMLLALLPFAFFTWGNTSRYLYLPAMGFALLVAELVEWVDGRLSRVAGVRVRLAIVTLLMAFVTIRFASFASRGVSNFTVRTERYRRFTEDIRRQYPQVSTGSSVAVEARVEQALTRRYLEGLVQWEYRDPTLTVTVQPQAPR